jgi:hypothetical protein
MISIDLRRKFARMHSHPQACGKPLWKTGNLT